MNRLAANVVRRFLAARAQLKPGLEQVEKLFKAEKWDEATEAMRDFGKGFGVFFLGGDRLSVRTEWFQGLDHGDKQVFMSWVETLNNIFNYAHGMARGQNKYEGWTEPMTVEAWFRSAYADAQDIQEMMRDDADAYTHGPFKIIPLKGVVDTKEAVEALDKASNLVGKKFPEVLYGKVYVRKDLRPAGSFDARPGSGGLIAGAYSHVTDTITISMYATADRDSVLTLIHEFGHRYHTKFLKGEKLNKFIRLSTVGEMLSFTPAERKKAADEYMKLFELHQKEEYPDDPNKYLSEKTREYMNAMPRELARKHVRLLTRFRDDKDNSVWQDLHDAIALKSEQGDVEFPADPNTTEGVYASNYGRESWEENFADSFLAFVLGKPLPLPLQRFMASL